MKSSIALKLKYPVEYCKITAVVALPEREGFSWQAMPCLTAQWQFRRSYHKPMLCCFHLAAKLSLGFMSKWHHSIPLFNKI